jgi:hypothetical protein
LKKNVSLRIRENLKKKCKFGNQRKFKNMEVWESREIHKKMEVLESEEI